MDGVEAVGEALLVGLEVGRVGHVNRLGGVGRQMVKLAFAGVVLGVEESERTDGGVEADRCGGCSRCDAQAGWSRCCGDTV
jgi:hypothetical protein